MRLKRMIGLVTLLCLLMAGVGAMLPGAQAAAKYYITVDITNQIVTVYKNGDTSEAGIVRQMICSTGKSGTPTPTGTYTLPTKTYNTERREWYYFPKYKCYAKWATRIVGGILFHSVLYTASKAGPTRSSVNALGSKASHGCVRLRVADSKWIALNCPAGTQCKIFNSGSKDSDLRRRLLKRSFSSANETYDHFMGLTSGGDTPAADTTLAKGSTGTKVKQLQARLKALGFLNDSADGRFGAKTQTAVKSFQAAIGQKKTGKVDDALWQRIFSDSAPTGTQVPLSTGMSGPAVAALQRALAVLKVYGGAADGSYDAATAQAVRDYQDFFGFAVNGKASTALQRDALQRADDVKAQYGDSDYRMVPVTEETSMARVKGASSVALRAKAKSSAKTLVKLKKGTEVRVLARTGSWAKVSYDQQTGYIQTKYLTFFTGEKTVVTYEPVAEPTPSPTPEIYIPTPTPTAEPTPTPTPEIYIPTPTPTAEPTPSPTPEIWIPTGGD